MEHNFGIEAPPRALNRQIHGLRGLSALLVFLYHVYGMGTIWGFWPHTLSPLDGVFSAGKHGVEIFFVISGYLITGSLIRHGDAKRFLIDRAIRLYPVFMTIQLLVFGLGPFIHYKFLAGISALAWLVDFVENALFLPGVLDLPLAQLNAWSLSYEAVFYLVTATLFVVQSRLGAPLAWLGAAAAILILIPTYPRAVFFLPGVAVFILEKRLSLFHSRGLDLLSLPALVAMLALLTLGEASSSLLYAAVPPALILFGNIVVGRCLISALLRTPFLQYLGTISYSFYLWSPVVTFPMKIAIQNFLHSWMDDLLIVAVFTVLGFGGSVLVAGWSYRVLEQRVGGTLRRRFSAVSPLPRPT